MTRASAGISPFTMRRPELSQAIAVFGGRFDPPHLSHVRVVQELLEDVGFGEVWIIPTGHSAYKPPQAAAAHRLELARLAFGELPHVRVLDLEVLRPGNTYTADTLRALPRGREYYFVLGTDQLAQLPQWHDFPAVLGLCNWWVLTRQEGGAPQAPSGMITRWETEGPYSVGRLSAFLQRRLIIAPTQAAALSSTGIRRSLALEGTIPPETLPTAVEEYLKRHRLYGS